MGNLNIDRREISTQKGENMEEERIREMELMVRNIIKLADVKQDVVVIIENVETIKMVAEWLLLKIEALNDELTDEEN